MNYQHAKEYVQPINRNLWECLTTECCAIICGPHWKGMKQTQEVVREVVSLETISVEKISFGSILQVIFQVKNTLETHINMKYRLNEIKTSILSAFSSTASIVNDWVCFSDKTINIVVKQDNYFFHIHIKE